MAKGTVSLKIAILIHRYGSDIVGGAETHARQIAHKLKHDLGYDVDVLTTTAREYTTWKKYYDEGESWDGAIRVLRFHPSLGRSIFFKIAGRANRLIFFCQKRPWLKKLGSWLENLWILLQGPFCPKLIEYAKLHQHQYHKIIFFTYLYHPTLKGLLEAKEKAILVPTAHDEAPFHFQAVKKLLHAAPRILVNSVPEKDMILEKIPGQQDKIDVVGLGIKLPPRKKPQTTKVDPYILYLGRICRGKGVQSLIDDFVAIRSHKLKGYKLVLAGHLESDISLPDDPRINYRGYVSSDEKQRLLLGATAMANPSPLESLSLIVLEAMASRTPVLVNRACEVLSYYATQTSTVIPYTPSQDFEAGLLKVSEKDWTKADAQDELEQSRDWVARHYSWPAVLKTYERAIQDC